MVERIASVELAVGERLSVFKQRLENGTSKKRICVVSGTHGDELEGQYVCWKLVNRLSEELDLLDGIVDVYPALNPLGINAMMRGIPQFDLDMNRIFPGDENGTFAEFAAAKITEDLKGAALVVDIHASNIFLREVPQIRVNVLSSSYLLPLAENANMDLIWVHESSTVLESTLAYTLNAMDTPTLVAEMGVGMRITESYGEQLTAGILNLMRQLGIYKGETQDVKKPIIGRDGQVSFLNADKSGIFLPKAKHNSKVEKDEEIGRIINPIEGTVKEVLTSPCDGWLFTLREYPVVYSGSLIARILNDWN